MVGLLFLSIAMSWAAGPSSFHNNNIASWSPLYLGTSLAFWLNTADTNSMTKVFNTTGTTGTGTSGSNTITSAASISTSAPVGTLLQLGADTTNTYRVTAITGTTITVTPALAAAYSAQTINSEKVSTVADRSGNGRNVVQATVGNMPVYSASAINNMPGLFFYGTQYLNTSATPTWLNGVTYTIAVIGTLSSTGNVRYPIGSQGSATNAALHFGWRTSTDFTLAQYGDDADWTAAPAAATLNPTIMIATKSTGAGSNAYLNGTTLTPTSTNPSAYLAATGNLNIGAGYTNSGSNWSGWVTEWVVAVPALTTAQRQSLEGYLAWKWGAQSYLPAGHPYKNYAP